MVFSRPLLGLPPDLGGENEDNTTFLKRWFDIKHGATNSTWFCFGLVQVNFSTDKRLSLLERKLPVASPMLLQGLVVFKVQKM